MACYHVHWSYLKKGAAQGRSQYIHREDQGLARQKAQYIGRDGPDAKQDLLAKGAAHLPEWAHGSATAFWAAADQHERKNARVGYHLELTLPKELSWAQQQALAADIREVVAGQYVHSWALHGPRARDGSGITNVHMHLLLSPRRLDGIERASPEAWFKQAAGPGRDPVSGGLRSEQSWRTKERLLDIRASVAMLTNASLERAGIGLAVDHRSLEARGLSRDPARYQTGDRGDERRTLAYREQLRTLGVADFEQLMTYGAWQDQRSQLLSIDRQYVKDLARDHLWRHDRSPAREIERAESLARTLDHVMEIERQPAMSQEITPQRVYEHAHVQHRLRELAEAFDHEQHVSPGLRVRLHERDRDQGMGIGF